MKRQDFVKKLQENAANYFKEKKCAISNDKNREYILDSYVNWRNNIILPSVLNYLNNYKRDCNENKKPCPFHKWLHHGLSSQACLFNLFGPFLADNDWGPLKEILMLSKSESGNYLTLRGNIDKAEFEYSINKTFEENRGQPTSIDLYVHTEKDEKIFIEFKFTESGFGVCSVYENGNCDGANPLKNPKICYLNELGRSYIDLMKKHELLIDNESCPFVEFYQAYRLLLFSLENDGHFVFIYDDRNPSFINELNGERHGKLIRFIKLLPERYQHNIYILTVKEIVHYLQKHYNYTWLDEFKKKYLLQSTGS